VIEACSSPRTGVSVRLRSGVVPPQREVDSVPLCCRIVLLGKFGLCFEPVLLGRCRIVRPVDLVSTTSNRVISSASVVDGWLVSFRLVVVACHFVPRVSWINITGVTRAATPTRTPANAMCSAPPNEPLALLRRFEGRWRLGVNDYRELPIPRPLFLRTSAILLRGVATKPPGRGRGQDRVLPLSRWLPARGGSSRPRRCCLAARSGFGGHKPAHASQRSAAQGRPAPGLTDSCVLSVGPCSCEPALRLRRGDRRVEAHRDPVVAGSD
jgi:hypothetical protein